MEHSDTFRCSIAVAAAACLGDKLVARNAEDTSFRVEHAVLGMWYTTKIAANHGKTLADTAKAHLDEILEVDEH